MSKYSSSPTLIELPPQLGRSTLSPDLTEVGTIFPSLSGAPGPVAMTLASGRGEEAAEEGRKIPEEVLVSGLKRCTSTRSRRGTTDLMDRMVD